MTDSDYSIRLHEVTKQIPQMECSVEEARFTYRNEKRTVRFRYGFIGNEPYVVFNDLDGGGGSFSSVLQKLRQCKAVTDDDIIPLRLRQVTWMIKASTICKPEIRNMLRSSADYDYRSLCLDAAIRRIEKGLDAYAGNSIFIRPEAVKGIFEAFNKRLEILNEQRLQRKKEKDLLYQETVKEEETRHFIDEKMKLVHVIPAPEGSFFIDSYAQWELFPHGTAFIAFWRHEGRLYQVPMYDQEIEDWHDMNEEAILKCLKKARCNRLVLNASLMVELFSMAETREMDISLFLKPFRTKACDGSIRCTPEVRKWLATNSTSLDDLDFDGSILTA